MRDYDDYGEYHDDGVRLHTPVIQRVLILAAVIIAVPVVMWSITAFVRSYVARPKVPVVQHLASTESPTARVGSPAVIAAAPAVDQGAPPPQRTDAKPPPAAAAATLPPPPVNVSPPAAQPPASIQPPAPTAASVPARAGAAGADSAPPPLPPAPPLRTADSAPAASDRGLPWSIPNSNSPPSFGSAAPAAPAPPPRTAALEALPATDAIRGPIPLPRHRPGILATATSAETTGSTAGKPNGPVPLPRVRPVAAPTESPSLASPSGYDAGLSGH